MHSGNGGLCYLSRSWPLRSCSIRTCYTPEDPGCACILLSVSNLRCVHCANELDIVWVVSGDCRDGPRTGYRVGVAAAGPHHYGSAGGPRVHCRATLLSACGHAGNMAASAVQT